MFILLSKSGLLGLFATNKRLARMKNTFNFVITLKLIKIAF